MQGILTVFIIVATAIVSAYALRNKQLENKLLFSAYSVFHHRKFYRMVSHGLIHGSFGHLFFNMLALYFFGIEVEMWFKIVWGSKIGSALFLLFYVSAIAVSSVKDLFKYKNDHSYKAIGASGAVSAVLFAAIFFNPLKGIYIYFIPQAIPGFIFAPLYLVYCQWMAKRNTDNIGHTAHFWGAVYGFLFPLIIRPSLIYHFIGRF